MTRSVDCLEGLALVGRGRIGPFDLAVPTLLGGPSTDERVSAVRLHDEGGAPGTRHLVLSGGGGQFSLRIPVLAPEVAGTERGIHAIGAGALLAHFPFDLASAREAGSGHPDLVVLGNSRSLWNEGETFVRAVREVRSAFGPRALLWTPRVALPHRVAFLTYLGVDLLDTTEAAWRAAEGTYFDLALGAFDPPSDPRERACPCPACSTDPPGSLVDHACFALARAMAETRAAARVGRLRELVEARLVAEPALGEMLRYSDRDLYGAFEERIPVTGNPPTRTYVIAESHRRPEMVRFRQRLLERYRPPASKSVLLLVPCSKTKPYRRSRSHRRFAGALEGLSGLERVHFVSVSSPIGLVPRELEDVYPARHYDIPVTGDWTETERAAVRTSLDHLLDTGRYRSMVVHLDPSEYRFVADRLPAGPTVRWTICDDRTTSTEAVASLRAAVSDALRELAPVAGGPLAVVREELQELASVQFGRAAADRLFTPPVRLAGRPWFQRLTDGRSDLATVREERGLFHLTVAGARRLGPPYPLAVEVDPTLPLTGDLFAPGVRAADPGIRVGDSVILLRQGLLAGVGEAVLPGPLMGELAHGLAVRVRHREHGPTDTTLTEERSPSEEGPVVQR
jgi:archaeosine synthase alpha-subunit